ncbi:hypothetical protein TTRE_0000900901 [Trichuris trichiura]|uniref:C2H2-type domain-containing protein n=1 Tax=Trichuris trichiura TaxID=36087 RepID=A0A077ZLN6_TRITR|nr:hypothetical protein TTRE_0000900901 [Trichuris trichiura]
MSTLESPRDLRKTRRSEQLASCRSAQKLLRHPVRDPPKAAHEEGRLARSIRQAPPTRRKTEEAMSPVQPCLTLPPVFFPGPFPCAHCSASFTRPTEMTAHLISTYGIRKISFMCRKCQRTGSTMAISVHYSRCGRTRTNDSNNKVPCLAPDCPGKFQSLAGMRLRARTQHPVEFVATRPALKRPRWGKEEEYLLAQEEANALSTNNPPTNIKTAIRQALRSNGPTRAPGNQTDPAPSSDRDHRPFPPPPGPARRSGSPSPQQHNPHQSATILPKAGIFS